MARPIIVLFSYRPVASRSAVAGNRNVRFDAKPRHPAGPAALS